VDKLALGKIFLPVLGSSPASIFPPFSYTFHKPVAVLCDVSDRQLC